ncbi:carbohydrate ABC transporter permease [Paenibacillus harenae]|uniref:Multiple sugar transport system permease protein n=1 Tax=Paenibacillus harenae TaxID=306543 RepID=A0ABT9UAG0_PAEHA|nr:sugar ABC transporter permease [Paenibacillus harenae]MDQ0116615.1 multiple sugar transport system permease protein [Paenibacillus harenae]
MEASRITDTPKAGNTFGTRLRKGFKEYRVAYLFILPTFLFMILVHIFPMIQGFVMSFLKLNQFTLSQYLNAPFAGVKNYFDLLFNESNPVRQGLGFALRNTAIYSVVVTVSVMVIGLLVAMLLNRDFPGRGIARAAMLLPWVVPSYVVGVLWGFMWQKEGIINHILVDILHVMDDKPFWLIGQNTIWAIIIPTVWRSWPFIMVVFLAGLQTIPDDLYEAAKIDGAGRLRQFFTITLPMLKPIIAVQLLFQIINNVYSYNIVAMMFGNGSGYPGEWGDLLMTALTRQTFGYWSFGVGAAASFILMGAMLVVVGIWYRIFRSELRAD